ncbi:aldehyde dehydrogenase family protein [Nocardia nova]|uniref:aldehyde dehydrogenase family protein n=1 Tax=Nocardia nova TaxID=37330 RepID=UPI000CEA1518|nr:aldehyde dehydrogenase family protein [Nocardia nova]PPJ24931.1 aldehyde dehydrogenase [Nocardia nova]
MAEYGRARSLIAGEWITPDGDGIPVIDPFTEQPIGEVGECGPDLVAQAVAAADEASAGWAATAVEERAELLERVADKLLRDTDTIAGLVSQEMGMPVALSRATQAELPAAVLRATAESARQFPWSELIEGATLERGAAGVVAAITPWNFPVHQIVAKVAAALAAGCTIVLKPSELTPFDAGVLAELFLEAGCPPGVLNIVTGTGPVSGAALAGHPGLGHVTFTGSVGAGRTVAGLAARTLTRCTLELGGKSPVLLLPDADMDAAVEGALGSGLVNSGQACNATTRMLVPAAALADVGALVHAHIERYTLGDPADPATRLGPLASARQRDRVLEYIDGAIAAGATLITGSAKPSQACDHGYFVDPTVITDLDENARAVREEIFGPVIVIQTYTDTDDAVRIANDCEYGLSAEIWSADTDRAKTVASRLDVGQVKINGVRTRTRPSVPFGGRKNSGYGRELGTLGIEEFIEVRAVMA